MGVHVTKPPAFTKPLVSPNQIHDWIHDAAPGAILTYFVGHLAWACGQNADLLLVSKIALAAAESGKAYLTQSRYDADNFYYQITRAKNK